jgi:hypothetical protein
MPLSLGLDILVAGLLIAMIGYAVVLNRRLAALRDNQAEINRLAEVLTKATGRAQDSIATLRQAGEQVGGQLEKQIAEGRALSDELVLIIGAGNNLAERLEQGLTHRHEEPYGAAECAPDSSDTDAGRTPQEQKILRALGGVR